MYLEFDLTCACVVCLPMAKGVSMRQPVNTLQRGPVYSTANPKDMMNMPAWLMPDTNRMAAKTTYLA